MKLLPKNRLLFFQAIAGVLVTLASAVVISAQATNPVIIIPGLTGSELVNQKTGEVVWFKAPRSKDDDLRLPVSANLAKNRDNLIPGDILRSIKVGIFPRVDAYAGLIDAFKNTSGYHEEMWDAPTDKGAEKAIYVYPYDWRLDNVENARMLIRRIEELKKKLKRPNLRFNVVGHSMGGIIARYAAMYGDADLPVGTRKITPTWAGAKHFGKVVLMGTPNEGSALALRSLTNGSSIGGLNINLPWIQNLSKFDIFTIPSSYQLLPAPGTMQVIDEDLEPLNVDIYDPKVWTKYGWNVINDKRFVKEFTSAERRTAPAYFAAALLRAKRLHEALTALSADKGIEFDIIGADCKDALDTIVVRRERKSGEWKTLFKPDGFTKSGGEKVTEEELKRVMLGPGDGVVTKRSLGTTTISKILNIPSLLRPLSEKFVCEEHSRLGANVEVQNYLIGLFGGKVEDVKAPGSN